MSKRLILGLALLLLASMAAEPLLNVFIHEEVHHPPYYFPGYYALLSIAATTVTIAGSKALGRFWLDRDEDYYD